MALLLSSIHKARALLQFSSKRFYKVPNKFRPLINFDKVPVINFDTDVEEIFTKGSGPGGQNVNKTENAVTLIHLETRVVVKCHESRSLPKNREIARKRLVDKLDNFINKDLSVEAQFKRIEKEIEERNREKARLKREEKARLKAEAKLPRHGDGEQPGNLCAISESDDRKNGVEDPTGRL